MGVTHSTVVVLPDDPAFPVGTTEWNDEHDVLVETGQITDGAVTPAKLGGVTTDRILGRDTAGTGLAEQLTLDLTLEFTGSGQIRRAALVGEVTAPAGSNTTTVANAHAGGQTHAQVEAAAVAAAGASQSAHDASGAAHTLLERKAEKGVGSGYAPLGSDVLVPDVHLPVPPDEDAHPATAVSVDSSNMVATSEDAQLLFEELEDNQRLHGHPETYTNMGATGTAVTVDLANGNGQGFTVNANCVFTLPSGLGAGQRRFTAHMVASGANRTVSFAGVGWAGGTPPTFSIIDGARDIYEFITKDGGAQWYGSVFGQNIGLTDHGGFLGLADDDHTQYVREDTVNAKGDLLVATANDTVARLGAGANGQKLVADSTQTTGVKWG